MNRNPLTDKIAVLEVLVDAMSTGKVNPKSEANRYWCDGDPVETTPVIGKGPWSVKIALQVGRLRSRMITAGFQLGETVVRPDAWGFLVGHESARVYSQGLADTFEVIEACIREAGFECPPG